MSTYRHTGKKVDVRNAIELLRIADLFNRWVAAGPGRGPTLVVRRGDLSLGINVRVSSSVEVDVFPRTLAGKLINTAYYVQLHIAQKKFLIPDSDNAHSVIMHRLVSVHPEKIWNLLSIKVDHVLGNFQTEEYPRGAASGLRSCHFFW